jgi:hypothetical protein
MVGVVPLGVQDGRHLRFTVGRSTLPGRGVYEVFAVMSEPGSSKTLMVLRRNVLLAATRLVSD